MGQSHIVRTLQNAISSNRIAHAYLFTGPRGTGKTSAARLLAKALNCEKGPAPEPCNECDTCVSITQNSCMDVYEMDAASESGVDEVRETIVQAVDYQPAQCRYRVFIVDEVHDLSSKAFDALLKTIEEPPPHVILVLATTEFHKVPETIRSRCQNYEFHRATVAETVTCLERVVKAENMAIEPAAVEAIARLADGGYRDALGLLEQAVLTGGQPVTLQHVYDQLGLISHEAADELLLAMHGADVPKILELVEELYRLGRDPRSILDSLLHRLADLTRSAYGVKIGSAQPAMEAGLTATAAQIGKDRILEFRTSLSEANRGIREVSLPNIWLEAELLKLAMPARSPVAAADTPRRVEEPKASASAKPTPAVPKVTGTPIGESSSATVKPTSPVSKASEQPAAIESPDESDPMEAGTTDAKALLSAEKLWQQVVDSLSAHYKTAAMKLAKTRISVVTGDQWTVDFERQLDCDYVSSKPLAQKAIFDTLHGVPGAENVRLIFQVAKSGEPASLQGAAVELPAEGERLASLAEEVFRDV